MPEAYTDSLRITKIEVGAATNTWGTKINDNVTTIIEEAIVGYTAIALAGSNVTLSTANGTTDQARQAVLKFTGTPGATRTITAPDKKKTYWIINGTTDSSALDFKASGGASVTVPSGSSAKIYCDGATNAVILWVGPTGGTLVTTTGTQTLTNKTIAGSQVTGAYTANGMTMATARLLGRTTASTGAAEEITVGSGLSLAAGSLTATATGFTWSRINTNTTAAANNGYMIDTSGGAVTLTLAASPSNGDQVAFTDANGTFQTNNLTINPNGKTIMGDSSNQTVSTKNFCGLLVYNSNTTDWRLAV